MSSRKRKASRRPSLLLPLQSLLAPTPTLSATMSSTFSYPQATHSLSAMATAPPSFLATSLLPTSSSSSSSFHSPRITSLPTDTHQSHQSQPHQSQLQSQSQYYLIEEEQNSSAQPSIPCSYTQYDDDQVCFAMKMPDDPFMLEFTTDYFHSDSKSTDYEKEVSRPRCVVSPGDEGNGESE